MSLRVNLLLFCISLGPLLAGFSSWAIDLESLEKSEAFWQKKPDLMKQIREDRKIVVSVIRDEAQDWVFKGVGQISAPVSSAWRQSHEVEKLGLITKYIKSLKYDSKENLLQFKLEVFDTHFEIKAHLQYFEEAKKIHLRVIEGPYQGLTGVILFKDIERLKSDAIFFAKYQKKSSPIPDWLFSFTLEAVMHHVASNLRVMVENDFQATGK